MNETFSGYQGILTATDFSEHAQNALRRSVWIAQQGCKRLTVAHVVADLRKAVHQTSYRSRIEFLEGSEEHFQRELRRVADEKLKRQIISLGSTDIDITYETLLGEPYEELIHSVQQEGYDLVVAGTRGQSPLTRILLGSTAKRLIRKCPASVWIVKNKDIRPPASILAAVDMSNVSRRALAQAIWVAEQANARLQILHVIESTGMGADLLDARVAGSKSLRGMIEAEVTGQFNDFVCSTVAAGGKPTTRLLWGSPAPATLQYAQEIGADLIVLGTVGRTGLAGMLLGNTAETVLTHADCDVLTVKPAEFVSPIAPAGWALHPGPVQK